MFRLTNMKKILLSILLLILIQGCGTKEITPSYSSPKKFDKHMYDKAQEYLKEKKFADAQYYLEDIAQSDNYNVAVWAKGYLGWMYLYGKGVVKDYPKAKSYLEYASYRENKDAKYYLSFIYTDGYGVEKDLKKAKELLEQLFKDGYKPASSRLAWLYFKMENYTKAKPLLEKDAEDGNPNAMERLGWMYLNGHGVIKDESKAKYYFEKASNKGNKSAKFFLAEMYYKGKGVPKDYKKAIKYYTELEMYSTIGWIYYTVDKLKDYKKAKEYFEKSIDSGHKEIKTNIALLYFRGQGVKKDYKKAKKLFEEAANTYEAFADPRNNLAWLYLNGYGVKKDVKKALKLFKDASEKGNVAASLNLAWIYKNGIDVKVNQKTAKYWQEKADKLAKTASQENYELTYIFDAPKLDDSIALLLKKASQKKIDRKKYLIVIGAENYEYTDNIVYSQHSSQMFTKVAQKIFGITSTNTLELTNKNASMGRIQMKIKKLLRRVKKGDTLYFYYSGHGVPVISQRNEPYLLPIDVEPEYISEAPFFKLKNIYKTLTDSKASKVIAFVDSCFSGATDGVSVIKGVAATRLVPKNVTFDKKKMVILTAGKDRQYSNMYEDKKYRLFSYFLMESILKGRRNIQDLYRDVYIKVKDKSYEMGDMKLQEPTFSGNRKLEL